MNASAALLSRITAYTKYQRYIPQLGRKETWNETIDRNKRMHLSRYTPVWAKHPELKEDLNRAYQMVTENKILPSMRSMQFAGLPISRQEARMFNCAYLPIKDLVSFREVLYLLLCGTGVGYSVQHHHIAQLPKIYQSTKRQVHAIDDSIEGWADAVDFLMGSFMDPNRLADPVFDARRVRPKGALIRSIHVRSPGPEPLVRGLELVTAKFKAKGNGTTLTPIEVMDSINILSECALAGGVRRSAMICLFSPGDPEMLHAKDAAAKWWVGAPWRSRSNNSAVILRTDPKAKEQFDDIWSILAISRSGEPGLFLTSDPTREVLTNPCVEVSLNPYQFCNLTEINGATVESQADFEARARAAALLGTLQAGYTSFHYLRPEWKRTTESEALLGVGITGIGNGAIHQLDEFRAARAAVRENIRVSGLLGINRATRVTTVKPSGTTALIFGCASGIHPIHSRHYIRRIRLSKHEPLYAALHRQIPDLLEDDVTNGSTAVLSVPIAADNPTASYRTETPITFLERVKRYQSQWIEPGHVSGINSHSVSATASLGDSDWDAVGKWLWDNRESWSSISVFPKSESDSIYKQTPFEECDRSTYERLSAKIKDVNLDIIEDDSVNPTHPEIACAGGQCEVSF